MTEVNSNVIEMPRRNVFNYERFVNSVREGNKRFAADKRTVIDLARASDPDNIATYTAREARAVPPAYEAYVEGHQNIPLFISGKPIRDPDSGKLCFGWMKYDRASPGKSMRGFIEISSTPGQQDELLSDGLPKLMKQVPDLARQGTRMEESRLWQQIYQFKHEEGGGGEAVAPPPTRSSPLKDRLARFAKTLSGKPEPVTQTTYTIKGIDNTISNSRGDQLFQAAFESPLNTSPAEQSRTPIPMAA